MRQRAAPGWAVQVHPTRPKLQQPGNKRLKLKCDVLLPTFRFKFNLRRYILAQAVANIMHATAKMSAAAKLGTDNADVQGMLVALEKRAVQVAPNMNPQHISNWIWSYATLGRELGTEARAVLEAGVVRVAPGMKPQELSNTVWAYATLGWEPGPEVRAALEAAGGGWRLRRLRVGAGGWCEDRQIAAGRNSESN